MGIGIFNFDMEWQAAIASLDTPDTPFRVHYTPNILALSPTGDFEETRKFVETLPELNTDRLFFTDHVKLFTDGAFFSQLMMVAEPGYLDGHEGEWLMVPENFEAAARPFGMQAIKYTCIAPVIWGWNSPWMFWKNCNSKNRA